MKRLLLIALLLVPLYGLWACGSGEEMPPVQTPEGIEKPNDDPDENGDLKGFKLRFTIGTDELTATLENNALVRDLISLLPLTVDLNDYVRAEKIFYPPRKLVTDGTPAGADPSAGDIAYYAPWGNVAIYYTDVEYSSSLYRVGKIDVNLDILRNSGDITNVRIELIETN